jgi:hypothetical protein
MEEGEAEPDDDQVAIDYGHKYGDDGEDGNGQKFPRKQK